MCSWSYHALYFFLLKKWELGEQASTCYMVALGNGVLRLIDCREPQHFSTTWALEYTQRRSIGCMTFGGSNEVIFTYKKPNTLNIVDLRKTNYSSITGKKTPVLLSSATLTCACPLSLDPFFTEVCILWFAVARSCTRNKCPSIHLCFTYYIFLFFSLNISSTTT